MKNLVLILLAMVVTVACSSNKDKEAAAEETVAAEWPAMDAYHLVMAEAFHPYKDSANLEPVKAQAAELAKAAEAWVNAPLPEKVNNDEVKATLAELKTNSDALAQLVATGTPEEIGAALTALHDQFHELQEAWYGGGEEHHHHDH
jgi:hypothetical protein